MPGEPVLVDPAVDPAAVTVDPVPVVVDPEPANRVDPVVEPYVVVAAVCLPVLLVTVPDLYVY